MRLFEQVSDTSAKAHQGTLGERSDIHDLLLAIKGLCTVSRSSAST
jgi:hypothetical protein